MGIAPALCEIHYGQVRAAAAAPAPAPAPAPGQPQPTSASAQLVSRLSSSLSSGAQSHAQCFERFRGSLIDRPTLPGVLCSPSLILSAARSAGWNSKIYTAPTTAQQTHHNAPQRNTANEYCGCGCGCGIQHVNHPPPWEQHTRPNPPTHPPAPSAAPAAPVKSGRARWSPRPAPAAPRSTPGRRPGCESAPGQERSGSAEQQQQ